MDLESRSETAHPEGAEHGPDRWPQDEAGPLSAPPLDAFPPGLTDEVRAASIDDLLGWVEQAQAQPERPLQLQLAVARATVEQARTHRDEEGLVLEGLRRERQEAGPWWWPGSWRRRGDLGRRITQRQQVLTRLTDHLRQAEGQVSEVAPASQAALEASGAEQRRILDRAVAAAQELERRNGVLDGRPLDLPGNQRQAPSAAQAVEDLPAGAGQREAPPARAGPVLDRTNLDAPITTPQAAGKPADVAPRRLGRVGATNDLSIAIVGGSLTGPVLCLLLRQAGFNDVRIYEATPSAVPQAGGVIGLDHTALGVFDSIGVPQDEIIPFPSERVVSVKVADRREVGRVQTLYPGRNTTWTLAHHALTERLPAGSLQTGVRLTGLQPGDDGRAVLQFAGGEHATADLVAFADGRRSTGRTLLDPERPLHYAGYVAHRGQLDYCPPELRDTWRYEPGGTQFNVFPIRQPGEEGIGTDWTFYLNTTADQFRTYFGADPTTRTFVLPQQVSAEARAHVDAMATKLLTPDAAELVHRTSRRMAVPVLDIDPPTRMVYPVGSSHAVLLGDALAPVRPHTARGANNGIDQAVNLAAALANYRNDGVDLDLALDAWQDHSLPLVNQSLERGPELGQALGLGL
jgi:2-polyprenyl-6-methoxyphenol hydroxylase-like FAD-dependent oxidoreductase